MDERQRAQAQEVHLEQPDALDLLHPPLGRDLVAAPLVERSELGDRPGRDHDARGVHRRVPGHALEPLRDTEQVGDARVVLLHLAQRGVLLESLVERHVEHRGDLLGHAVDVGVGHVHHAADVAHHGLRLHGAEGDDLRDVLAPVLARDVLDHLAPAALAEVDVDIRKRDALGVEEALEQQVELQRVDVGDAEAVRHEAAGRRSAAGPHRDVLLARVADELPRLVRGRPLYGGRKLDQEGLVSRTTGNSVAGSEYPDISDGKCRPTWPRRGRLIPAKPDRIARRVHSRLRIKAS